MIKQVLHKFQRRRLTVLKDRKFWLIILLFGSLWGGLEVLLHDSLKMVNFSPISPVLTTVGFLTLAVARMIYNKRGSSAIIGGIAGLYKFLGMAFFPCQLFAVILQGATFDVVYSYLDKRLRENSVKRGVIGSLSAYLSYLVFVIVVTYIVPYSFWPSRGLSGVLNHAGIVGSFAALGGFLAVSLGERLGRKVREKFFYLQSSRAPLFYTSAVSVILICWILGVFL